MMSWSVLAALMALGAVTGFAAGLLGIGGAMIMVPFLTMLFTSVGMPAELVVKLAIATSMSTILFTSISSVRAHHKRGAVRWPIAQLLAPGILLGSLLGAQITGMLPGGPVALIFAGFVGFSATRMLFKPAQASDRGLPGRPGMLVAGGLIGVVSAMVGAGGGFVSVPFMARRNVPMHQAVATSSALGFPIAAAGTVGYMIAGQGLAGRPPGTLGYVVIPAMLAIAAASVITAPLGARTAHALDTRRLSRIFAVVLYALAAYMLWKGLRSLA